MSYMKPFPQWEIWNNGQTNKSTSYQQTYILSIRQLSEHNCQERREDEKSDLLSDKPISVST